MNQCVLGQISIKTPLGRVSISASEVGITAITFGSGMVGKVKNIKKSLISGHLEKVEGQLEEYFTGSRQVFDIPFDLQGTAFQKQVWGALAKIPFGKTKSYKELAQTIKNPLAVRAVGGANGKNPICILIPCHRVIAHNGGIGGYSGGLKIKAFLLEHERRFSKPQA